MEAGNEEAIRGLLGALEAEPEMEILVLEMVNGGGGGGSQTRAGEAGWNTRSQPEGCGCSLLQGGSGAKGAQSVSGMGTHRSDSPLAEGHPPGRLRELSRQQLTVLGVRVSAQLSTRGQRVLSTDQLRGKRAAPCGRNVGCREGPTVTLMSLGVGNHRVANWARITAPASQ